MSVADGSEPGIVIGCSTRSTSRLVLMSNAGSKVRAKAESALTVARENVRGEGHADEALAEHYGTTTRRLNEQARKNRKRFPPDSMFELTNQEVRNLKSQSETSSAGGRRRSRPFAFTQQGPTQPGRVTVIGHPGDEMPKRTFASVRRQAGLERQKP